MATKYTQFFQTFMAYWTDNCPDPDQSRWSSKVNRLMRLNVSKKEALILNLNNGATSTLQIAGRAQADWEFLVISCIGAGHVTLAGQDALGAAITSNIPTYGTPALPGIVVLSTYNLTANPIVASDQDGSIFTIFASTCQEDGT